MGTRIQVLLCLKTIKHNLNWKVIFFKQTNAIGYVTAKLTKYFQISLKTSSDLFYSGLFKDKKAPETSFLTFLTIFVVELYAKTSLSKYYINKLTFIAGLCLLPKLFCKTCLFRYLMMP